LVITYFLFLSNIKLSFWQRYSNPTSRRLFKDLSITDFVSVGTKFFASCTWIWLIYYFGEIENEKINRKFGVRLFLFAS